MATTPGSDGQIAFPRWLNDGAEREPAASRLTGAPKRAGRSVSRAAAVVDKAPIDAPPRQTGAYMADGNRKVDLGVWRTPLEPAPRLGKHIGLPAEDLWIKRDDWLGLGGGGNKLRKLEYLCAGALEQGASVLVTSGAAQSNYCRLTAAAARRLGLGVVLVLEGDGCAAGTGNLTLDALFEADIRWAGEAGASGLDGAVREAAGELRARGERPAVLPFGGSDARGALGYLAAAAELQEQAPDAEHVVVAVGSGGTMAGLVAGLGADRVLGVDAGAVGDIEDRVKAMLAGLRGSGRAPSVSGDFSLRLDREQIGPGYQQLTDEASAAMADAGRCEGLILDPVYTAKAFAGLRRAVSSGEIRPGRRTVFVHTGGLPGLYGHPAAAELAARTGARGRPAPAESG
jgi:L-cysteate sulfo-lyase